MGAAPSREFADMWISIVVCVNEVSKYYYVYVSHIPGALYIQTIALRTAVTLGRRPTDRVLKVAGPRVDRATE